MSESTAVLDSPADTVAVPVETAPTTALPAIVSETDDRVRNADLMTRYAELYKLGTEQPALREQLDARAFALWVRAVSVHVTDTTVVAAEIDLPRYDSKNGVEGSKRYTAQRAQIAALLCEGNGVAYQLTSRGYAYPKPTSKRKNYYLNIWGTRADVDRTVMMFKLITERAIRDAYIGEHNAPLGLVFDAVTRSKPAQQTRIRRQWMRDFVDALGTLLDGFSFADKAKRELTTRVNRADVLRAEFVANTREANASRADENRVEIVTGVDE